MWWLGLAVAHAAAGVALGEGVVLDVQRETVYLAVPGGGVEAVAVGSGKSLWVSTSGDFPLASSGDLVVTWKDSSNAAFRIVGLDASRKGGTAVRCADVVIPNGLPGAIDARLGGSATVTARVREQRIEASWSAESHYAGGAYPSDELLAQSRRWWSGSGSCAMDGTWTDGPGPSINPTNRAVPAELQGKAGMGYRFGAVWQIPYMAWEGSTGVLHLQTWDIPSATQVSDVALAPNDDLYAYPSLSVDGRLLALLKQGSAPSSQLFETASGKTLSALPGVALINWTRVGETYLTSSGNSVAAYNDAGKPLWSRDVRVRYYAGPYPP